MSDQEFASIILAVLAIILLILGVYAPIKVYLYLKYLHDYADIVTRRGAPAKKMRAQGDPAIRFMDWGTLIAIILFLLLATWAKYS